MNIESSVNWLLLKLGNLCYFFWQSGELAENVSKIIDSQLSDAVDMSEVQVKTVSQINHLS